MILLIIGGIEDISYLYLAKYVSKNDFVSLKYTDLTLSTDFELIQELQVLYSRHEKANYFEYKGMQA